MQIKTKLTSVSPTLAQKWLDEHNPRNRNIMTHVVDKYARDMSSGRWHYTGDPIQFDQDGNLINGQHRLSAVVKSGKTIQFSIVSGLDPEAQDAIDAGALRTAGQQMGMDGTKHGNQLASVIRILLKWNAGTINGKTSFSTGEIKAFQKENEKTLNEVMHWYYTIGRQIPLGKAAIGAFVFQLFDMANDEEFLVTQDDVIDFLEKLEAGHDLGREHPILALRNSAIRTKSAGRVRTSPMDLYKLVRTWNAYVKGETYRVLVSPRDGVVTMNHLILEDKNV